MSNVAAGAEPPAASSDTLRRNRRFGLLLGMVYLALLVTFIIIFTRNGFPKDPKEFKRLQQLREAAADSGTPADHLPAPAQGESPAGQR